MEELWNLDRLFNFPMAFPSLELAGLSARYRLLMCEVPNAGVLRQMASR